MSRVTQEKEYMLSKMNLVKMKNMDLDDTQKNKYIYQGLEYYLSVSKESRGETMQAKFVSEYREHYGVPG